jgi:glutathione S-transferase
MTMLTVHHLGISQSDRIVWLCEELEIPYALKLYARDPVTRLAPPEYKALHPAGTAPVITDGDVTLGESGAIIDYIIHRYGGGRLAVSPSSPGYVDYLRWFHFSNGSMMPAGMIDMVVTMLGVEDTGVITSLRSRLDTAYVMVEERLADATYFAGSEFTAADIIMLFPLTTMRMFAPRDLAPYPNIRAYLQRIAARPAYQRAIKKADPDLPPVTQ